MKRRTFHLTIDPISSAYRPGYPAALTPQQFRELVAPRMRLRLHKAALSATLALAGSAGLVDFLNAYTDGPDLDLSAILWQEKQRLYVQQELFDTRSPASADPGEGAQIEREFKQPATLVLRFNEEDRGAITRMGNRRGRLRGRWERMEGLCRPRACPR